MMENQDSLLITGASSGIGRLMAIKLSGQYRLILGGRDADRLQQTLGACQAAHRHVTWSYDLADVESIVASLERFLTYHDVSVSAFVHCAGQLSVLPLRGLSTSVVAGMFHTNVFSAIEIVKALTKKKINKQRLRSVVFISSIVSKFGAKGFSAYAASKGALDALMKSLAVELAPEVRVNSVLPGALRTPMTQAMFDDPELVASFQRTYPLGLGESSDVIEAVEFLVSERARWITGQQIVVDGGRTSNISA